MLVRAKYRAALKEAKHTERDVVRLQLLGGVGLGLGEDHSRERLSRGRVGLVIDACDSCPKAYGEGRLHVRDLKVVEHDRLRATMRKQSVSSDGVRTGRIYKLTSPSGKSYVGQTVQCVAARVGSHRCRSRCFAIGAAIRKYGLHAFEVVTVTENVPLSEIDEVEDYYIKHFNTMKPHGYNLVPGRRDSTKQERYRKFSLVAKEFSNTEEFKNKKRELWKDPEWAAAWRQTWMEKRKNVLSSLGGRDLELKKLAYKRNDRVVAKRKAMKDPSEKAKWDENFSQEAILERRNLRFFNERIAKVAEMSDADAVAYLQNSRRFAIKTTRKKGATRSLEDVERWYPKVDTVDDLIRFKEGSR